MTEHGKLIFFDGTDGVGKTTQLALAADNLRAQGREVYTTRSHGGTPIGEALREASLSKHARVPLTDLYISLAMHAELQHDFNQKRAAGITVLVDRGPLAIIAYQAFGSGLEHNTAYKAVEEDIQLFDADLIIVYDAAVGVTRQRMLNRNQQTAAKVDYFESKPIEYFERVAEGYREAAKHFGALVINADQPIDTVHQQTMAAITAL